MVEETSEYHAREDNTRLLMMMRHLQKTCRFVSMCNREEKKGRNSRGLNIDAISRTTRRRKTREICKRSRQTRTRNMERSAAQSIRTVTPTQTSEVHDIR